MERFFQGRSVAVYCYEFESWLADATPTGGSARLFPSQPARLSSLRRKKKASTRWLRVDASVSLHATS
jgi:hypothetical protein